MATAKKPVKRTATRPRSTKVKAPPAVSPLVMFLALTFTGLSIVFALVAYVYYG